MKPLWNLLATELIGICTMVPKLGTTSIDLANSANRGTKQRQQTEATDGESGWMGSQQHPLPAAGGPAVAGRDAATSDAGPGRREGRRRRQAESAVIDGRAAGGEKWQVTGKTARARGSGGTAGSGGRGGSGEGIRSGRWIGAEPSRAIGAERASCAVAEPRRNRNSAGPSDANLGWVATIERGCARRHADASRHRPLPRAHTAAGDSAPREPARRASRRRRARGGPRTATRSAGDVAVAASNGTSAS